MSLKKNSVNSFLEFFQISFRGYEEIKINIKFENWSNELKQSAK